MFDFVEIATSSRRLIARALAEDDDFTNIENEVTKATVLDQVTSESFSYTDSPPLLSKTAEAELYLLATNFLLCKFVTIPGISLCHFSASHTSMTLCILDVAMVIITTIVAKIYFPESLERGNDPPAFRGTGYLRRDKIPDSGEDEEIVPDDLLVAESGDDENILYSDDDDIDRFEDEGEEDGLLMEGSATRASILEFDQEQTSRTKVVQRLLFCSLMLNVTFVTWGAIQERMLTRRYPRHTGEYFTYSYALVFTNRFWTLIMSGCMWLYLKPRRSQSTVLYEYSFPSISNMLSSWCQYEALRYVSFPATTLFKSFKLAPVMLMGKILGNKSCK